MSNDLPFQIRRAVPADSARLSALIAVSSRTLVAPHYNTELVEHALERVLGVDTSLIADGTYFVAEEGGALLACGGWSRRSTVYGSDAVSQRDDRLLDPDSEAARIRAFFVHPDHVRRGIAGHILARCELEARREGFRKLELGATLSGVDFYLAAGFRPRQAIFHDCGASHAMEILLMEKTLD